MTEKTHNFTQLVRHLCLCTLRENAICYFIIIFCEPKLVLVRARSCLTCQREFSI